MANSTTNLDTISSSQASKEVTANALFDAASPGTLYGRRATTTTALTWGFYGGMLDIAGTLTAIANATVALTASNTNYVVAARATGVVTASTATTNWTNTVDYIKLYSIVAGASTITSYTDYRSTLQTSTTSNHIADTTDAHTASAITNTPAGNIAATTVQAAIDELDSEKSPLAGSASITTTGALNAGSITSGFGAIDIGTDALTAGSGTFTTGVTLLGWVGSNPNENAVNLVYGTQNSIPANGVGYAGIKHICTDAGNFARSADVGVYASTTDSAATLIGRFSPTGVSILSATTASAANLYQSASNTELLRSTSSLRYKRDVETLDATFANNVLDLRPVWYRSKATADKQEWSYYGLIAEEVALVEPRLVHWAHRDTKQELISPAVAASPAEVDAEGVEITSAIAPKEAQYKTVIDTDSPLIPDGVQYERLSVLLLDVIKRQQAQLAAFEARLTALEAV